MTAAEPAPASSGAAPSPAPSEGVTSDGKVILNRASLEDLRRLPGVGPKRAQAILDLRAKLGRFRRATDLLRIKGIGPKSLKRLEPHFVLDPPAAPPSPSPNPNPIPGPSPSPDAGVKSSTGAGAIQPGARSRD
jgi:competence protein ComEA